MKVISDAPLLRNSEWAIQNGLGAFANCWIACSRCSNLTFPCWGGAVPSSGKVRFSGSYVLANDIATDGLSILDVSGDSVNIDLNGKTISCAPADDGEGPSIGIDIFSKSRVHIRNGSIRGCDIGIRSLLANDFTIDFIDFSKVRYTGIEVVAERLLISNSKFSHIGGHSAEAYSIGINVRGAVHCHIEKNEFSELYRQERASTRMLGEGVGVIVGSDEADCIISHNKFENQVLETNSVGLWVAENGQATLTNNLLLGFELGFVGHGKVRATDNVLRLDPPGGNNSYGIYGGPGSTFSGNKIVGFQNARSVMKVDGNLQVIE